MQKLAFITICQRRSWSTKRRSRGISTRSQNSSTDKRNAISTGTDASVLCWKKASMKVKKIDDAVALYEEAAACEPMDAMERMDVEMAKEELED